MSLGFWVFVSCVVSVIIISWALRRPKWTGWRACSSCYELNAEDYKFCSYCGMPSNEQFERCDDGFNADGMQCKLHKYHDSPHEYR